MSMQPTLTVTGFVGSVVRLSPGGNGSVPFTSFRLGCTPRVHDRETQAWRDGATQWYTVKVWRHIARNVAESLHKGDPVVVTGRLSLEEWPDKDGVLHTSQVIEAIALGHDLVFGESRFARTTASSAAAAGVGDETVRSDGVAAAPIDLSGLPELAAAFERDASDGALAEDDDDLAPLDDEDDDEDELAGLALPA
jgi:single-strand DNA-binding protein